jgi:DNA-binding transcriptional MerR regulator
MSLKSIKSMFDSNDTKEKKQIIKESRLSENRKAAIKRNLPRIKGSLKLFKEYIKSEEIKEKQGNKEVDDLIRDTALDMIDSNLDKMKDNIKHKQTMKSLNDRLDALKNSGGNKTKRRNRVFFLV